MKSFALIAVGFLFTATLRAEAAAYPVSDGPEQPEVLHPADCGDTGIRQEAIVRIICHDSIVTYRLQLTHWKKGKIAYVDEGKRIRVWTQDTPITGTLHSITRDSILVGSQWIGIRELSRLRVHTTGTNLTGIIITGLGTMLTVGGVVMVVYGIQMFRPNGEGDPFFGQFFRTLAGLLITGTGLFSGTIGIGTTSSGVLILVLGKNYNLLNKWRISSVGANP